MTFRTVRALGNMGLACAGLVLVLGGCDQPSSDRKTRSQEAAHARAARHEGEHGAAHAANDPAPTAHRAPGAQHEHGHPETVRLSAEALKELDIQVSVVRLDDLPLQLTLPGEVVFNPDRVAHVVPRAPGVVRTVYKAIGDSVSRGEVLAVFDSRELAQLKADYLGARARLEIARANFQREKKLWQQKISAESEYLDAKQALRETQIQVFLSQRQLHALGLSAQEVMALPEQPESELTRYELTAPLDGTVIERHLTRGEVVPEQPTDPPFMIADLTSVWVHLTVYPKDLDAIRVGQRVTILSEHKRLQASAIIAYLSPSVSQDTRTATARVELPNPHRRWRPGLFVTGEVETGLATERVVVPRAAVQTVGDSAVIFVQTDEGFEPRAVALGRISGDRVEVRSGLDPGERYVRGNAFTLKAEFDREALEHAGHAH